MDDSGESAGVERLGKARIRDRGGQSVRRQRIGRLEAYLQPRAEREQRDRRPLAHDPAFSDLERSADLRHVDADAVAAEVRSTGLPAEFADKLVLAG